MSIVLQTRKHDQYMTRKETWEQIVSYIPENKTIWEPFMGNGQSAEFLKELGFNVIVNDEDFFETPDEGYGDIIVSNIPFSSKVQVLHRLKSIGKPFIILVPSNCLFTKYFKEIFGKEKIQLIIPSKRIQYDDLELTNQKNRVSFTTVYLCWKMNLNQDLIFM